MDARHDQKAGLDRRVARLPTWTVQVGLPVVGDERHQGQGAAAAGQSDSRRGRGGALRPAGKNSEFRAGRGRSRRPWPPLGRAGRQQGDGEPGARHDHRADGQGWPSSRVGAPFGLQVEGSGRNARLVVNEQEAATIRKVAELLVDERMDKAEAARTLNALGMLPRQARRWSPDLLRQVMSERARMREVIWGKPERIASRNGEPRSESPRASLASLPCSPPNASSLCSGRCTAGRSRAL